MIFDTKEQRDTILKLIEAVSWPGSEIEKAAELKIQVRTSKIMSSKEKPKVMKEQEFREP